MSSIRDSFILTPFVTLFLYLLIVTLSSATISVVAGRASLFSKCWVFGFGAFLDLLKPIVPESPLLKWKSFRWDPSQLSRY